MENKKLIDANEILEKGVSIPGCVSKMVSTWDIVHAPTVDAVPVDEILFHRILIDENGIPEVKLQFGERTLILRRENDPMDVREVVHGRWIEDRAYSFDPYSRVHYKCSICGRIEENKEPYCNCGAKMDLEG